MLKKLSETGLECTYAGHPNKIPDYGSLQIFSFLHLVTIQILVAEGQQSHALGKEILRCSCQQNLSFVQNV